MLQMNIALKVLRYTFRGNNSAFSVLPPFSVRVNSYKKEFALGEQILSFKSIPYLRIVSSFKKVYGN